MDGRTEGGKDDKKKKRKRNLSKNYKGENLYFNNMSKFILNMKILLHWI